MKKEKRKQNLWALFLKENSQNYMKITDIKVDSRYKKSFRKLPPIIQRKAILRINIFRENSFNPRLKTHSLSGREEDCWSFWVDYNYRIKFIFLSQNRGKVLFLDIGTHEIYQ